MTDKDIHALEERARENSGEKGDEPRKQDPKSKRNIGLPYKVFSKYYQMGGLLLLFVQYS